MEAVPRMPMLSFELKQCPEYVDFGPVLKQYIKTHYGEDPAHYNKACSDLEQLRQSAIHVSHDFMGCSTLKKYFAQLQFLQGRFPMGEDGECGINFTWEDVFLGREVTIPDVKFEQACILYNIGALHSILGTIETRQNADGMKVSCTHFQCAAWAFEYLRDHFGSSNLSVDMSHEVLTFQVSLMLAQAQECILEKSMIDSRKNTITAKVAAQVTEFYRAVIRGLQAENMDAILGSRQFKEWKRRAEMKILFYEVITNYYMGKNSEEQEKFGECVAYYTLAFDKLKDCAKMAKNESSDIQESLRFMNDVVGGKYQSAKKDNDFVYHDKIPAADTLPEVKGASLVKGIPFNWNDSEVSGPDIFQKLVPMSAHEASSMYSEEKAKLLRQVGGEIEDKNVALLQFMSSLNLDPGKLNFEPERLPQDLLEKCAAVSVRPNAIKDLTDAMGAVSNSATEVQMAIDEINALIENDAKEDEEFQKQFGKRTSNPMLPEIKKECDRFEEGHKKGNQSNVDLHKAMNTHIINLRLLAGPLEDIKNHLPSLDRDKDPETEAIIRDLQKLLNKVEEMKGQRSMLEEQFRSQVKDDDITNRIVSQDGSTNPSVMFGEQIKKHDKQIELIRQNLNAQDNILRALTEANAQYANTRRSTAETQARREATIEELKNSYDVYEDLLAKSQKGLEFYKKLESNINRLLERCRGICKQQAEERKQIQDRLKPKEPQPKPAPSSKLSPQQGMSMADPGLSPLQGPSMPYASPSGVMGPLPDIHSSLPGFEGPKLKDYLPFMKPKTFGKKGTGSLPSSGVSSPVHLPQGPDSVPGSPLHGMSDEDLRRLGISDPKVLAMIKAHSVPSSSASGMGPGPGGPPRQPDPMMNTQPMRHPSPSQSPNMMGVQNIPGRVPSTGVRFDRSTKPNYPQNAGPQSAMQPGMPQQNFGPNQQYGPQPQMPTSSQAFYNANVSPQIYGPAGGNVPQVQSNIGPNQPGGPQGQQTMIQPSSQPQYSGMNTGVSYPSPAQSPQIPTDQSSDPRLNVTNTSQPYQVFPRQSTSQMDNVGPGQGVMPGRSSSSDTNVQAFSQGPQFVPIGHPAQAGISPPLYGDTQRDSMNQLQPQPPQSIPNQPTSYISGQENYQQPQSISCQGQNYQQPQTSQGFTQQPQASQGQNYQQPQTSQGYSQQPPVNMSSGYQQQQMGQGQNSRGQGQGQYADGRGTTSSTGNSMSSVSSASQQVPSSGMYGYSHMGQGQPDQRSLPSSQPGSLQQPGYASNQQLPQGQGPASQGFGQNMNYGQAQNFPQQQVPSNVGQGQPQQGQGQIRQHQVQQPQGPNTNQQYTGPRQSQNQVEQPVIQGQSQHAYGPQGQMSQANTHPQQQSFTSQGQVAPRGGYSLPPSQSPSNQGQINQPQVQTGQQGQMLPQQQPQMQSGYVSKPHVQNIPDGKSQGPSAVQQGGQFSQYGQNVSAVQSGQSVPQQVTGPMPAYSQPQSVQHGYQVRPSGTNQNQPNTGQYQTGPPGPSPVNQAQQYYPGQQQGGGTLTQQPVQGPWQQPVQGPQQVGGTRMQQPLQGPQQGSGTLGQQPIQGAQQPLASQQQNVRPQMPTSSGQFGSLNPQNQQQQVYRPQIPQSSVHQGPGQGYFGPSSSQGPGQGYSGPSSSQGPGQGYSGPPSSHSGNVGHSQQLQGQNINFPPQQTGQHSNLSSQQTGQHSNLPPQQSGQHPNLPPQQPGQHPNLPSQQTGQQGFNTGLQTSASFPQSQGYYQHQPSGSTLGPQPRGSLQQPSGGTLGHQSGGSLQPQPKIDENMAPLPHYSQAGSSAGQSVTSQVQPTMSIGHMTTITAPYPGSQARQGPAPGWQRNPTVPQMGTGTPQPMPSSSVQQLNPLSPPDVLPQPILPSPIKPEVHTSLQDVTMETPIPKQEVPPRAQDSPVSHKRQEKTHSRSNSNTSQSDYKVLRKNSSSSIGSSLDDILSSSPLDSTHEPPKPVLTPKVLTAQEIAQQKEEAMMKKGTLGRQVSKDPYPDSTKMDKFVAETEKLAKFVESLSKATCSGPSHLDIAWKEIIEDHDIHGKKHSMAIGRCYPMKNRDQDVLPYDETRVLLTSHKDDYINASWINDLAESCPKFIATQAPLHSSLFDFWLMVYEQGSEVIVMLSSDVESKDTKKFPEYWPSEKGRPMHHGPITLTLQSFKDRQIWTERIIYLQHQETKQGRTIVQLQFMNWPVSGFPEKIPSLLMFIHEVHTFYRQQRSLLKPVMVHCSNGIGRTGAFLMVYTGMQEIDHGNGIINVQSVARKMLQQRRYIIREKSQLKFCYEAILYHAQDILGKQGILVHKASFGGKLPQPGEKSYQWTPTDDVIFGSTCSISDLKSNVEKMGFHLGLSGQQSSPKKQSTAKQEVTDKKVENDQRPSSPPNKEELTSEGTLISALPDVVQRTESSRKHVEGDQILSGSLSGSNASLLSIGSEPDKATGTPVHKIRSGGTSPKPGSFPGSHEGSPKLQSLLDPSTFSIGSDSGKRKITKASFVEKTSSLSDNVDMSDPLSSLDPLWSMKK